MTWTEKVELLTKDRVVDRVGQEAGWPKGQLSNYLREGRMPNAEAGVRLAKALNVTADWLFDPTQGMPAARRDLVTPADWAAEDWATLHRVLQVLRSQQPT